MKRTTALIATLLALVVVLLPSVASAASLNVRGPVMSTVVASGCDKAIEVRPRSGQPVLTEGTTRLFEATGVDRACAGRQLAVTIFDSAGAPLGTAEANIPQNFAGGTVNFATGPTVFVPNVAGVAATIGTWGVHATWTLPGTVLPLVVCRTETGATCSPSASSSSNASRVTLTLTGGSLWSLDFNRKDRLFVNMSHELWGGRAASVTVSGGTDGVVTVGWPCASNVLALRVVNGYWWTPVTVTGYSSSSAGALRCVAP